MLALEPPSGTEALGVLNRVFAVFALLMAKIPTGHPRLGSPGCPAHTLELPAACSSR
ncbi:hypothetical protein [Streptomyces sp. NBC_01589]|uniref:hypothetical protein n=1 Tax=unclassified Streptomyces TaxID=2593676 RepID=UPI003868F836